MISNDVMDKKAEELIIETQKMLCSAKHLKAFFKMDEIGTILKYKNKYYKVVVTAARSQKGLR